MKDDDDNRGPSKASSQKTSTPAKSFMKQPKPAKNSKLETTIESNEPKYEPSFTPVKKTTTFKLDEEKRYSEDFEEIPKLSLDNQSTFSSFPNDSLKQEYEEERNEEEESSEQASTSRPSQISVIEQKGCKYILND
jgi:hypothetical protein